MKAPNQLERNGFEALRITGDGKPDASFRNGWPRGDQARLWRCSLSIGTTPAGGVQLSGFSFDEGLTYRFTTVRYLG